MSRTLAGRGEEGSYYVAGCAFGCVSMEGEIYYSILHPNALEILTRFQGRHRVSAIFAIIVATLTHQTPERTKPRGDSPASAPAASNWISRFGRSRRDGQPAERSDES